MASKNKLFIIVSGNRYPEGDAGAVRTHAFAKIFSSLGFRVLVIGMGETTNFKIKNYDEIDYCSLRYNRSDIFFRAYGRLSFCRHCKSVLKEQKISDIAGIMYVSGGSRILTSIKRMSSKYGVPLYFDSVEWYSPCEYKAGVMNLEYMRNDRLNRKDIDKRFHVFAISRYMENYFKSKTIPAVRIPVIMDVAKMSVRSKSCGFDTNKINIIYAGSPGRKDHLQELIDAIGLLDNSEKDRVCFRIVGMSKEQYEKMYGCVPKSVCGRTVIFEGRKSRNETLQQLRNSDFSFLLRPSDERYTKAGFPTKAVESLASGVPLLCNYSSDLDLYLKDGENSIIVENCTTEACLNALRHVIYVSRDELAAMKINARKTAEDNFDWRLYESSVCNFIKASEKNVECG